GEFAAHLGAPSALALSSCTAGLHTALATLGAGPGDEVITPPLTFTASVNVIAHVGARPVLVDVEPDTLTVPPAAVAAPVSGRAGALPPWPERGRVESLRQGRQLALRGARARLQVQHDRHSGLARPVPAAQAAGVPGAPA